MKTTSRLLALLLTLTMLFPVNAAALSAGPATLAAQSDRVITGSITATLRVDYAQRLSELKRRDVRLELFKGNASLGQLHLAVPGEQPLTNGCTAVVSARNADGGDLGGGQWPAALEVTVNGLPQDSYQLKLTGQGYRPFSCAVTLGDYAQHVTLGTGDATFTLGDVNGDGAITTADRAAFDGVLGSSESAKLAVYDLNGDGAVNIVDIAYVNRLTAAEGAETVRSTTLLAPPAILSTADSEMAAAGTSIQNGTLSDLFDSDAPAVELTASKGKDIVLPLPLEEAVNAAEVRLTTPHGTGGEILTGVVLVEDDQGRTTEHPFDYTAPENVHAIGEGTDGAKVITISLGKRVAVKKITVTVTKTVGGQFAAVEGIQFLQDIVPEVPVAPNSVVKASTLKAEAGSEQISLRWGELPNVSGYKVLYWPQDNVTAVKEKHTDKPSAVIDGLENLKAYDFTVTPTDGTWEGQPSAVISATPLPASAPDKIDGLSLKPMDGSITAAWKQGKSATYYQLFYHAEGETAWTQFGGDLTATSASITGLTNDVTYYVRVRGGNDVGVGPFSAESVAIPKAVKYERPEGIPTAGLLDNSKIASITLADSGNYDRNQYTAGAPFSPNNLIDGDYRTHWTAANWWRNEHVNVTFKEPVDLQAIFWVPRLDSTYASNLRSYSVRVWYEGEDLASKGHLLTPDENRGGVDNGGTGRDVDTWPSVRSNPAATHFALLPFTPAQKVVKLSVAVEQRAYLTVSCAQLLFMEYDPAHCLPAEIEALFANDLHTSLKEDVTQAQIDALTARLNSDEKNYYVDWNTMADELKLADELLNGGVSSGLLKNGLESRGGAADSAKYSQGGSVFQPLGVAANARSEITIYAEGIPEGQSVNVIATQFNAEVSAWQAPVGTLENGRNLLTIPAIGSRVGNNGGSLYVTYSGPNAENIRLHVRQAVVIPTLGLADWYDRTETERRDAIGAYVDSLTAYVNSAKIASPLLDYRNVTELSTPVVLLSLPALSVNGALGSGTREDKIDTLYASIEAWEDIMAICKRTQGIDKVYAENDMQTRQNIRCMTMFAGAFMYAAGNHIGIGYSSCAGMVTGKPISTLGENASANRLFGWGIAHEIGHNMDKLGKAEITNNIYSILVQTCDGAQGTFLSRLEKSGKYDKLFTKVAQSYPGASNDVFVQLGMYYQLHLAYDNADPLDFYNRFFKAWKAGTYTQGAASYDDKVALTASGVAGADLTEFFTRWGMTLSASTKETLATYPTESRAVWYLSDQSRRTRLAGTAPATGALTARAQKTGDNAVTIAIDASAIQGELQGFEIRRGGKSIAFVDAAETEYVDVIGSANHLAFSYDVVAYDILGNRAASADAGEIRVAYDKTVDPSAYTVKSENGALVVTFAEETAVSGLKLLDFAPSGGAVTVSVADVEGKTTSALSVTLDAAHNQAVDDPTAFVSYFKLPGALVDDTRIGTYDAKTVTVEGVSDADSLRFISYPGDDVSFLDGATMGLLGADYTYDTLDGSETIPAGTLVIVGNYRGDPVYNTVNVVGRFTGTATTEDGDITELDVVERPLAGYALLFAALPEDGTPVSDLSDGLFLFIPDVQAEAELQETSHCNASHLLPSQIRLELYRTDDPNDASSKRLTAQTLWIYSPGGDDLPRVDLVK